MPSSRCIDDTLHERSEQLTHWHAFLFMCSWQPYASKCKVCKQNLHQQAMYCQSCAYQKGICAM